MSQAKDVRTTPSPPSRRGDRWPRRVVTSCDPNLRSRSVRSRARSPTAHGVRAQRLIVAAAGQHANNCYPSAFFEHCVLLFAASMLQGAAYKLRLRGRAQRSPRLWPVLHVVWCQAGSPVCLSPGARFCSLPAF